MEKCSYHLLFKCCNLREEGMNYTKIANELGINRKTLYNWIKRGKIANRGKFKQFYDKWEEANTEYFRIHPPKNTYNKKYAREKIEGYPKFKKKVLSRDGYVCICCGHDHKLEVHHINGVKDNPDMVTDIDNGITLCKYCHLKYHEIYSRKNVNEKDFEEFLDRFRV